jgi:hypothetical protein
MITAKKKSLRNAINSHCKSCVYDPLTAGTWLAQVTICPVRSCELFDVRPTTQSIPQSVFDYYAVPEAERLRLTSPEGSEGRFSEQTPEVDTNVGGAK